MCHSARNHSQNTGIYMSASTNRFSLSFSRKLVQNANSLSYDARIDASQASPADQTTSNNTELDWNDSALCKNKLEYEPFGYDTVFSTDIHACVGVDARATWELSQTKACTHRKTWRELLQCTCMCNECCCIHLGDPSFCCCLL